MFYYHGNRALLECPISDTLVLNYINSKTNTMLNLRINYSVTDI